MTVESSREVTERVFPELEDWKHRANEAYIESVWNTLKLGGVWGWPDALRVFTKVEGGWEEIRPELGSAEYFAEQERANREAGE